MDEVPVIAAQAATRNCREPRAIARSTVLVPPFIQSTEPTFPRELGLVVTSSDRSRPAVPKRSHYPVDERDDSRIGGIRPRINLDRYGPPDEAVRHADIFVLPYL
jgi:hypothetical protein